MDATPSPNPSRFGSPVAGFASPLGDAVLAFERRLADAGLDPRRVANGSRGVATCPVCRKPGKLRYAPGERSPLVARCARCDARLLEIVDALGVRLGEILPRNVATLLAAPSQIVAVQLGEIGALSPDEARRYPLDAETPRAAAADAAEGLLAVALAEPVLVLPPTGVGIPPVDAIADRDDLVAIANALLAVASRTGSPSAVTLELVLEQLTRVGDLERVHPTATEYILRNAARFARPEYLGAYIEQLLESDAAS